MTEGVVFRGYTSDPDAIRFIFHCKMNPLKKGDISRLCTPILRKAGRKIDGKEEDTIGDLKVSELLRPYDKHSDKLLGIAEYVRDYLNGQYRNNLNLGRAIKFKEDGL